MKNEAMLFTRNYPYSWRYYFKATDDYALSRCGLMNGMFSGFELGAQALEKYLKSLLWVQFHQDGRQLGEKTSNVIKNECRRLDIEQNGQHDLICFANLAIRYGFKIDIFSLECLRKFNEYYDLRYPDGENKINFLSSEEVNALDHCVYNIWDNFKDINEYIYYWCGPNSAAVSMIMKQFSRGEQYILNMNRAFSLRSNEIYSWIEREMANKSSLHQSSLSSNFPPTH